MSAERALAEVPAAPEAAVPPYDFDAFISYSHAADRRLASVLERELEWFRRPWYNQMRTIRVFRDESDLGASPELWPSIVEKLDRSRCFVLLASPEAAGSKWVGREIAHWRQSKGAHSILVALTRGSIVWDEQDGDFDWSRTSALPREALSGAFRDEPHWVDLTSSAQAGGRPSMRDAEFARAVLGLEAGIQGRPMDEVSGEALRVYRRSVATAWGTVASLAVLLVGVGLLGVVANSARDRAQKHLEVAQIQESRRLSDLARQTAQLGDGVTSILLALEALPADVVQPERPVVWQVWPALRDALASPGMFVLHGAQDDGIGSVNWSDTGNQLFAVGIHGHAFMWGADGADVPLTLRPAQGGVLSIRSSDLLPLRSLA